MTRDDSAGDRNAPPVNPTPTPHPQPAGESQVTERGSAPEELADRALPGVPTPSGDGMSAGEVTGLLGGDASMAEANIALETQQGVDPAGS